jgi:hypothetical protein
MAKEDLSLVRFLQLGDHGKDVVAIKRMLSRAGVGFTPVKENGKIRDFFGKRLDAGIKSFQKKKHLVDDGVVGYITFKALVKHADAHDSRLLREFAAQQIGDWGIIGRKTAFAGIDMGVDFLGKGADPDVRRRRNRTTRAQGLRLAGNRRSDCRPM